MGYHHFVISLSCCSLLIGVRAQENTLGRYGRPKRIIAGIILEENERNEAPFSSLLYYTWIGYAHDYYSGDEPCCRPSRRPYNGYPDRLLCGGSLIHPKVVQTACHCTVTWKVTERNAKYTWGGYDIRSEWEDRMAIFMGWSYVRNYRRGVKTSRFYAHPDCQKLTIRPYYIKYDFGWILLQDEVPTSSMVLYGFNKPMGYAYPYKKSALQELHDRVVAERHVCLVVGHGVTMEDRDHYSPVLKYGWIQLLDYTNCYDAKWKSRGFDRLGDPTYEEVVSWVCSTDLHPLHQPPSLSAESRKGDSGAPITCNNNYLFLVSTGSKPSLRPRAGFLKVSTEGAMAYTPETSTIENRMNFFWLLLEPRFEFVFGLGEPGGLRLLKHRNRSTVLSESVVNSSSARCFHLLHFVKLAGIMIWSSKRT